MMLGLVVTTIIALVTGIGTFWLMQHTHIKQNLRIFVSKPTSYVFLYAKDPHNLPEINFRVKHVTVNGVNYGASGREAWTFDVTGIMPHMGEHVTQVRSVADLEARKIHVSMVALYGLLQGKLEYSFTTSYDADGQQGTQIVEVSDFYIPWVLNGFINKTMRHTNQEMLSNLKYILEGGLVEKYDMDGDGEEDDKAQFAQELDEKELEKEFKDDWEEDEWAKELEED